jgi:glyoxylase-like metal-dependent hydrolase (beta-lactamase superfamily II)
MEGTVTRTSGAQLTVHTYTSPESGLAATTHILEFETQLVVIDAQYALPFATEAADYARSLGKPVTRLYISHSHPDHWFGSEVFDTEVFALGRVREEIAQGGPAMVEQNRRIAGEIVPDHVPAVSRILTPGEEIIDGVRVVALEFRSTESETMLAVFLPDERILVAQDLAYNGMHLFIAEGHLAQWREAVNSLIKLDPAVVLPGHGLPGDAEVLEFTAAYLEAASPLLAAATDGDGLAASLIEAFPEAGGRGLLDIQNGYLFPAK